MSKRYVYSLALLYSLSQLASCSKSSSSSGSINPDLVSGVAATGAPISGGKVKLKGADGDVVEDITTGSDGSYSANVAELDRPILVQVESPSGEKYISVASESALASGKKINVTPISHIIVANVFGNADADDLFANFTTESSDFSEAALEGQKQELFDKFVAAGLIGSSGVVGSSVDLLNGELLAGTSQGMDGLLDVIDVNTGAAGAMEIKLKGDPTPFVIDNPAVTAEAPSAHVPDVAAAIAQLSVIEQIRARLTAFANLHTANKNCSGTPVDSGACDLDTLESLFLPYLHADYQQDGIDIADGAIWDWICRTPDDTYVTSKGQCLSDADVVLEDITIKDVTLINYDPVSTVALIAVNIYANGELDGSEDFYMKKNGAGVFQILGNKKTFRYHIDTESELETKYVASPLSSVDTYRVTLSFWYNASGASYAHGQQFTLTALSGNQIFPGPSATMPLYLTKIAKHDGMTCSTDLAFTTSATPYITTWSEIPEDRVYGTFAQACGAETDPCVCNPNFDWETQKLKLTPAMISAMDKSERIGLTHVGGVATADEFVIKKPLVLNQYNASTYVPSFGKTAAAFCADSTANLALSVANGNLDHINLYWGHLDGMSWGNSSADSDLPEAPTAAYSPVPSPAIPGSASVNYAYLYLSSDDDFGRRIVRRVSCEN